MLSCLEWLLVTLAITSTVRSVDDEMWCDFIVVGAGTSSLSLAGRLAEIPSWKVCVFERGPMESGMEKWYTNNYRFVSPHDPIYLTKLTMKTMETKFGVNGNYTTNANHDGRMIYIPRFRGRGGTSRVYGAIARRASPAVLDLWPEGWRHEDMTYYYKKSEDHYCYYDPPEVTGISPTDCKKWHGKDGPMQLNSQLKEAFILFPREMKYLCEDKTKPWNGYKANYNGPVEDRTSCSIFQQYKLRIDKDSNPTKEARANRASETARGSSFTGYYKYNVNKPYLAVSAPVTEILFNEERKAIGVSFLDGHTGRIKKAFVRKEVIIGAGVFDTPHLLQVSGVGPKELLKDIGVDLIAENVHVGQHLWDQTSVPYMLRLKSESNDLCCGNPPKINISGTEYETQSVYSINGPFTWIMNYRSNVSRVPVEMTDAQLYVVGNSKLFEVTGPLCLKDRPNQYDDAKNYQEEEFTHGTIRVIDQWPEYRGHVKALTSNIFDKPEVEYGWEYTNDGVPTESFKKVSKFYRDQIHVLRSMFFGKNVRKELKDLILGEIEPGMDIDTDDKLNTWLRGMLVSALHPVGTCKMPDCADEFLQVRGVSNLRVCDASAFATQTDGNPSATLFAMGEKLADMLKFQYLKYVNVAVRKDLTIPRERTAFESELPPGHATIDMGSVKSASNCMNVSVSSEWISTGKDTSALIVKWSFVCDEGTNEREIADLAAVATLGTDPKDGCNAEGYPKFNRPEATPDPKEPTPKHKVSPYVFAVWCQAFSGVDPDALWAKAGSWKGEGGRVRGSEHCFTLNCQPEICSILVYVDDSKREWIYKEPDLALPLVDYYATKKVVARHPGSSAFFRTGSMIANPDTDWYEELAGFLLETVFWSSGRRFSREYPPLNTLPGWWTQLSNGLLYYETNRRIYSNEHVVSFDLDNTISKTKSGRDFPVDEKDWTFTSENVKLKIQDNHKRGISNVIMSNQAGIGSGSQNKDEWMSKIEAITNELGVPMFVLGATEYNDLRKPDTGMWTYYSCRLNQFKTIDPSTAVYVGDAAGRPGDLSNSDKLFAEKVGITFHTPEEYFSEL